MTPQGHASPPRWVPVPCRYLGATAKAAYAFTPFREGDILEFGCVRLKALETPGHTPESISILVYDLNASGTQAHAVLTGDTLFYDS